MNENRLSNERGQSLILVAVAMVALVIFVAITVDVSSAYYTRRTAQNAADGAALAGVSRMATGINKKNARLDDDIKADMNDFAELNGIEDTEGDLADDLNDNVDGWYVDMQGNRLPGEPMVGDQYLDYIPDGAAGIEAITYIRAPTYFGGIFGFDGYPLQARAVSVLKEACGSDCVVPIATNKDTLLDGEQLRIGECFNIWNEKEDGAPGSFGWISWEWQWLACQDGSRPCPKMDGNNGCNTPALSFNLTPDNCASGFIQTGDWVSAGVGVMNSDTQIQCYLDYYLGVPRLKEECGEWTSDDPQSFTVVVYDGTNGGTGCGNPVTLWDPDPSSEGMHYRVAGFAQMQILAYELSHGLGTAEQIDNPEDFGLPSDFDPLVHCESPFGFGGGNRITALFQEYVTDFSSSSSCYDPWGTLLSSPKLVE